jgi:hypothetical protein
MEEITLKQARETREALRGEWGEVLKRHLAPAQECVGLAPEILEAKRRYIIQDIGDEVDPRGPYDHIYVGLSDYTMTTMKFHPAVALAMIENEALNDREGALHRKIALKNAGKTIRRGFHRDVSPGTIIQEKGLWGVVVTEASLTHADDEDGPDVCDWVADIHLLESYEAAQEFAAPIKAARQAAFEEGLDREKAEKERKAQEQKAAAQAAYERTQQRQKARREQNQATTPVATIASQPKKSTYVSVTIPKGYALAMGASSPVSTTQVATLVARRAMLQGYGI